MFRFTVLHQERLVGELLSTLKAHTNTFLEYLVAKAERIAFTFAVLKLITRLICSMVNILVGY